MKRDDDCDVDEQFAEANERMEAQRTLVSSIPKTDPLRWQHQRVLSLMQTNMEALRLAKSLESGEPEKPVDVVRLYPAPNSSSALGTSPNR